MILQDPEAVAIDLEGLVNNVFRLLRELEQLDMDEFFSDLSTPEKQQRFDERTGTLRAEAEEGIAWALDTLHGRLLLYCEALSLPETRAAVQVWRQQYSTLEALGATQFWSSSEGDGREAKALSAIRPIVDGLVVLLRPRIDRAASPPVERAEQQRLEHCLRSMAKIMRERGICPSSESDVQAAMHSHLEGVFSDYTRTVTIAKPLLSFKPDGGVVSLRTAIECKFVASAAEVGVAMHGLTEDLSGYSGSNDWKQFYTLVYMTEPFTTESHISRALGSSGNAGAWTTVVVTGAGARRANPRKLPKNVRDA